MCSRDDDPSQHDEPKRSELHAQDPTLDERLDINGHFPDCNRWKGYKDCGCGRWGYDRFIARIASSGAIVKETA